MTGTWNLRLTIIAIIATVVVTVLAATGIGPPTIRAACAIALLMVIPGVATLRIVRASMRNDVAYIAGIGVGLSLAIGVVTCVMLAAIGILHAWTLAPILGAVSVGLIIAAHHRRPDDPPLQAPRIAPSRASIVVVAATVAGSLILITAAVVIGRTPVSAPSDRGYTVLAVAPNPQAPNSEVLIQIENHETGPRTFELRITAPRRPTRTIAVQLPAGDTQSIPTPVGPTAVGQLQAVLSNSASPDVPYRTVWIGLPLQPPAQKVSGSN